MQATEWYVNDGQGPQGPMHESQVVGLIAAGRIRPTAVFAPSGSQQWLRIDQVPVFQRAAMQAVPAAYPAPGPMPYGAMPPAAMPPRVMPHGAMPPGAMPHGAMQHRPAPSKSSSTPAIVGVIVFVLFAALIGFRYLRGGGYKPTPRLEATVEKGKVSKDGKTFTVTVNLQSEVEDGVEVTAYDGGTALRRLDLSDVEDGAVKAKFDVSNLRGGERELTLTVTAKGYMAASGLLTKVAMPPKIVSSAGRVWVDGRRGSVEMGDGKLKIDGEKGAKIKVGSREVTASGTPSTEPFDAVTLVEKSDLGKLSTASFKLPVSFTFADGQKLEGQLQVDGSHIERALFATLRDITKGPVVFGKRDEAPSKPRVLADVSGTSLKLHGSGVGAKSIDLVATREYLKRTSPCGTYRNDATGDRVSISREMTDLKYSIHERRTGKVVGTRLFRAPLPDCPEVTNREQDIRSYPDQGPIDAYLASLAGK